MSDFLQIPAALAALCFTVGYVLAKVGSMLSRRKSAEPKSDPEQDRRIRAVEADLRVVRKQYEEAAAELVELREARTELTAELDTCQTERDSAKKKLKDMRDQLQEECEKTHTLRTELTERAEQGIRAQVQIRDMETELSLAQGSSGMIKNDIDQLLAGQQTLAGDDSDDAATGADNSEESGKPSPRADNLALDC